MAKYSKCGLAALGSVCQKMAVDGIDGGVVDRFAVASAAPRRARRPDAGDRVARASERAERRAAAADQRQSTSASLRGCGGVQLSCRARPSRRRVVVGFRISPYISARRISRSLRVRIATARDDSGAGLPQHAR